MRKLSASDASFLYIETPETPMHGASLQMFEFPEEYKGNFYEDLKHCLLDRVHLLPYLRQHIHTTPLNLDYPVWVEDEGFEIDYHLRRRTLPEPGTMDQLVELAERLHPPLLDRSRPLWQYTVVDGLENGQAVVHWKGHHACFDGMASQAVVDLLYSKTPEPTPMPPPDEPLRQEPEPGAFAMLREAYEHLREAPGRTVRAMPEVAKAALKLGIRALDQDLLPKAPRTSFDVSITKERSVALATLPLRGAKKIAGSQAVTLNDVVMAICGGALRRYFDEKGELPEEALVALAPVSLRSEAGTELNNQVFGMMTGLATDRADPLARLEAVHDAAIEAKERTSDLKGVMAAELAFLGAPALIQGVVGLMASLKVVERLPQLFNVVISNVPGPRKPLYLNGARMVAQYPVSMPLHGCALNITVFSYVDSLDFGMIACRRAVPDIGRIRDHLVDAYRELEAAALG